MTRAPEELIRGVDDEDEMDKPAPDPLRAIRNRIDAIDEAVHRLLIDRSSVIAELIQIKGTSKPGAAFRPDREADMMRRLVMRHGGELPLATVEHIWREIITTFTAMQAPFGVVAGPAADPLAMRDVVRFYFGFSVPVSVAGTNAQAIAEVGKGGKQIAVVAAAKSGRWWDALAGSNAPKVFAKLPFIEIPDRPADLPAYVIGPPLKESHEPDVKLLAIPDAPGLQAAIASFGGTIAAEADGDLLVELPVAVTLLEVGKEIGAPIRGIREVGAFFQPIRFLAERVA
jgi:chorismate mutase/prephenate dehydratase